MDRGTDARNFLLGKVIPLRLRYVGVVTRTQEVCFATCFDSDILADIQAKEVKLLLLKLTSADVVYSEVKEDELASSTNSKEDSSVLSMSLVKNQFGGKYAISSDEFNNEMVGAKSCNIAHLKGKVLSWVNIPTFVALPFGVFETVMADNLNQAI